MRPALLLLALACVCWSVPAQKAEDAQAPFALSNEEKTLLELTNEVRARHKLAPLKPNPALFKAARAHSANMARHGEMAHILDGKNPAQRALAVGYDYRKIGENVAWTDGDTMQRVMEGWMNSKAHRENILEPRYEEIGLGIAHTKKGEIYYTQLFGAQRKKRPQPPQEDR